MEAILKLNDFALSKIKDLDEDNQNSDDIMLRLKNTSMRLAYSKILDNFYKDSSQLAYSHYHQGLLYFESDRIDQCIYQIQLAKKKLPPADSNQNDNQKSGDQVGITHEDIDLIWIECYVKKQMYEEALSLLNELKNVKNKEKYLRLKSITYQYLKNQQKSKDSYQEFYTFIQQKYGNKSVEAALCQIQIGKNYGHFKSYSKGIQYINQGIQILIKNRYNNPSYVSKTYETLSSYYKQNQDFQKQYTSLICAQSMARQLKDGEKVMIQILKLLAKNLYGREQKQRALEEYLKIEKIEKNIYGQASSTLNKTVKRIISIMHQLNRQAQARKYQVEYEHLVGSRVEKHKK